MEAFYEKNFICVVGVFADFLLCRLWQWEKYFTGKR